MHRWLTPCLLASPLALQACGPTTTSAPAEAAAQAAPTGDFAKDLATRSITDFHPSDGGGGATIAYKSLHFDKSGTWAADGYVSVEDEQMDCKESGSWTMDPPTAPNVAMVTWTVASTDCAGRTPGPVTRAQLTLAADGKVEALFR